jgi:CheY-like chemotaxis protein
MTTVPTQSRTMIALIDDDEQICLALRDWLELLEQPARYYLSAEALLADLIQGADGLCLRGAGERHAPLRAAVIDLNLPGMNGIDLAKALRLKDPLLTLVLITAAAWEGQVQAEAGELGVACLRKPFMLEALEQALIAR